MAALRELQSRILVEGEDLRISDEEVVSIQECLTSSGGISPEDLRVLIDMRAQARAVSPDFDRLFFPALKAWLLADGCIGLDEQFQILRLLYGGGGLDAAERAFLQELRRDAKEVTPEFEALYQQAMRD